MKKEGYLIPYCIFIMLIIFGITGCEMPWDSSDCTEAVIHIDRKINEVSVAEIFSLDIRVNTVSNLFAAPFYLIYDTTFLKFKTAAEGTFLNRNNIDPTTFLFSNDPVKGRIIVGCARLGQVPGVSGSGLLMTVTFEAIAKGTANISFNNANVKVGNGSDLETISINYIGAEVRVK